MKPRTILIIVAVVAAGQVAAAVYYWPDTFVTAAAGATLVVLGVLAWLFNGPRKEEAAKVLNGDKT